MASQNRKSVFLYEVEQADAVALIESMRSFLAPRTARKHASLLQAALRYCLPEGVANPFEGLAGRDANEVATVHRKPFTAEELQALIEAARGDDMLRVTW